MTKLKDSPFLVIKRRLKKGLYCSKLVLHDLKISSPEKSKSIEYKTSLVPSQEVPPQLRIISKQLQTIRKWNNMLTLASFFSLQYLNFSDHSQTNRIIGNLSSLNTMPYHTQVSPLPSKTGNRWISMFSVFCSPCSMNFFLLGMVLIPVSCTMSQTSVHSSLGLCLSDQVP